MVIVLMASLIATVSTMAIALQAHTSYLNSSRQSMAKRAREAAESGLAILVESLNQDYPEWLVSNYNGSETWNRRSSGATGCRTEISGQPSVDGISSQQANGSKGFYKLRSYKFDGTSYYGGRGRFVVEGEIRSEDNKRNNGVCVCATVLQNSKHLEKQNFRRIRMQEFNIAGLQSTAE